MSILCPECHKDDSIQKLSSIFSAGISSGSYSGPTGGVVVPIGSGSPSVIVGHSTLHGSSQTLLSSKLSPPSQPVPPKYGPNGGGVWGFLIGFSGGCILFAVISGGKNEQTSDIFPVLSILILAGSLISARIGVRLAKNKRAIYQQDMDRWNKKMTIWEHLYYCSRNDCVFDPTRNISAPANRMNELLL